MNKQKNIMKNGRAEKTKQLIENDIRYHESRIEYIKLRIKNLKKQLKETE